MSNNNHITQTNITLFNFFEYLSGTDNVGAIIGGEQTYSTAVPPYSTFSVASSSGGAVLWRSDGTITAPLYSGSYSQGVRYVSLPNINEGYPQVSFDYVNPNFGSPFSVSGVQVECTNIVITLSRVPPTPAEAELLAGSSSNDMMMRRLDKLEGKQPMSSIPIDPNAPIKHKDIGSHPWKQRQLQRESLRPDVSVPRPGFDLQGKIIPGGVRDLYLKQKVLERLPTTPVGTESKTSLSDDPRSPDHDSHDESLWKALKAKFDTSTSSKSDLVKGKIITIDQPGVTPSKRG